MTKNSTKFNLDHYSLEVIERWIKEGCPTNHGSYARLQIYIMEAMSDMIDKERLVRIRDKTSS